MAPSFTAARQVRDVWAYNLRSEFLAFLTALNSAGPGAVVALDTEFPGVLDESLWTASKEVQYRALQKSVELFRPIQLGLALASSDGQLLGSWSFNLHFDLCKDFHTDASVNFLKDAGMDFQKHASDGINSKVLGGLLAASPLVSSKNSPTCVTFSGLYDLGYLVSLLLAGPLPKEYRDFEKLLSVFCPKHRELREQLPYGSLESLAFERGIQRTGCAHNAASDAQLTLELYLQVNMAWRPVYSSQNAHTIGRRRQSSTNLENVDPSIKHVLNSKVSLTHPARSSTIAPREAWGKAAREAVLQSRTLHSCNSPEKYVPLHA